MGDFENALKYLGMADKYAKATDEKYLIAYNKAIVYYNMKLDKEAMQYAKLAQSHKNDPAINELIEDIQKLK